VPFRDPIAGGNGALVINHLQSDNFVSGVSGWQLAKNGNMEVNNGTFRGSVQVGVPPAAHTFLNPGNGDVMDTYDAQGNLVAQIIASGTYINYLFTGGVATQHMRYQSTGMVGLSDGDSSLSAIQFDPTGTALPTQARTTITVANNAGTHVYFLRLTSGSDSGAVLQTMTGNERGVGGSIMQSDQVSTNNLVHSGDVTGVTDANGNLTITHGASFTPTMAKVQVHDTGLLTSSFGVATVVNGTINATTFQIHCVNYNGSVRTSASVSVYYEVKG